MRQRGLPDWGEAADEVAAQAGKPDSPVWVLTRHGKDIVGCTSVYRETPAWAYTADECAEPALFLATTVTLPTNGGRIGCLIAWWALDRAARSGCRWVRRGTGQDALMRYYRDVQGWTLLRTLDRRGHTAHIMARRAELRPDLPGLLAGGVRPTPEHH
ncbi:GNAT family N-acetyltransferase [Streptomyces capparidis]